MTASFALKVIGTVDKPSYYYEPFKYYVSTNSQIFYPPNPYVSIIKVLKVSKIFDPFSNLPPPLTLTTYR